MACSTCSIHLSRLPHGPMRITARGWFIVNGIEERAIKNLFNAFLGIAQVDQPDRAALTDNPLRPFGGADHRR